jgi:hypothetical protein
LKGHHTGVLREGLRAEFPAAFDLAARLKRPAVPAMNPALAAVGALGVQSLTVALVQTVVSAVVLVGPWTSLPRVHEPAIVLGYALATVFAFGSARWRGVLAAVALFAVITASGFWSNASGLQLFCERSGAPCDWAALYWPQLWPELLGIALGLLALRGVRQGGPGIAALAVAVGVSTLAFPIGRLAFVPFLGRMPVGPSATGAINTIIGFELLGALAAGVVLGSFGKRHLFDALILIVSLIGPWVAQLFMPNRFPPGGFVLWRDWQIVVPVGYALMALAGMAVGLRLTRYRATRVPTIP